MRKIGTFQTEELALRFSQFLSKKGIENQIEREESSEGPHYFIWCFNEDQLVASSQYFTEFLTNPNGPEYAFSPSPEKEETILGESEIPLPFKKKRKSFLTSFFLSLCIAIYLINLFQEAALLEKAHLKEGYDMLTPIQSALLYDEPLLMGEIDRLLEKYPDLVRMKPEEFPNEAKQELKRIDQLPYWRGCYEVVIHWWKGEKISKPTPPLFEKIREGQVWRIISPAFLHTDFLHLLFNMFWLVLLGKQVEERMMRGRYLLLVVLLAAFSNTVQYLMSGPYFLGYSGVLMGLAGFIWMRQRKAPWEGYPLQRATFFFLLFFVGIIAVFQILAFILELMGVTFFAINIANTAHIGGALFGAFLGRFPLFSWRPLEP